MRELGLRTAQPRAKVRTTVRAEDVDELPDVVRRDFAGPAPGIKWCGDITCIRTWVGFVYLATVLDCCTKKVLRYALADHMRTELVYEVIDMAARNCMPTRGVTVFHSDRAASTPPSSLATIWGSTGFGGRWGVPGCAGTTRGCVVQRDAQE
ncbi:MAG: hypothetical protein E7Z95_01510 [Actinomyces succiniciruminis]|nr:hypothetical protein [Actinomyces succiniciruminis]